MKKIKKILIALSFLGTFLNTSVSAQGWEKIYTDTIFDYLRPKFEATSNGGFIAVYGQRDLPNAGFSVTQFDVDGNILWSKQDTSERFSPSDLKKISDSSYLCTSLNKVRILDSMGNILWKKNYGFPNIYQGTFGSEAHQTTQGEFVILGNSLDHNVPFIIYENTTDSVFQLLDLVDTSEIIMQIQSSKLTLDNNLILFGDLDSIGINTNNLFLMKRELNGDTIWMKQYDIGKNDFAKEIIQLQDGSFVGLINTGLPNGPSTNFVTMFLKFDSEGVLISQDTILDTSSGLNMEMVSDGGFILTFHRNENGIQNPYIMRLDSTGNVLWMNKYGNPLDVETMSEAVEASDGNFYAIGIESVDNLNGWGGLYIIKTDSVGNSWTNYLRGNIFYDTSENCELDLMEDPLANWIVSAFDTLNNTYFYGVSDEQGNYEIRTDTGTYITHLQIPNAYWSATCWNDSLVNMPSYFDTLNIDFPVKADYDCPILNVDISTPFLRRCFSNTYYVNYCNEGTVPAENAYIEVEFDEWLTVDSSSLVAINMNGQVYTFDIGTVGVGECGGFQIYTTLNCDSTVLGQTHCVSAHAFPDSICLPANTNWDGSTIRVDGDCLGDSLQFIIENIGTNPMSELKSFIVTEDVILHFNGTFQLGVNQALEFTLPVDVAHTYRLEAEQATGHPTSGSPSVTIEGCGDPNPLSLGFVNMYSEDDADPFISEDCQENIGSYDPNDKRGFPTGIGGDHIIFDDTELEYHIRFQNTGTDTAFLVVIRDTLSSFLDPATLRPGASSHPYTWTFQNTGELIFTFENIMLPDSNINEMASHGFVKFKIAQRENNAPGTIIHNQAGIYFDFNAPVITNQTTHKIEEPQMTSSDVTLYFCSDSLYTQDTIIITESPNLSWDVMTTNNIMVSSPTAETIDTIITSGEIIDSMQYFSDTTLVQYLTSIAGCDSVVTINLEVGINDLENPISNVHLFPNPTRQQVNLILNLTKTRELTFILRNSLGQELKEKEFSQKLPTGKNTVEMDLIGLADGIYWLEIRSEDQSQMAKIIVNQ